MLKYILKRLFFMFPVIIGITFFIYGILALAPGDPIPSMLGPDATAEQINALRHELGMDRPLVIRYLVYMGGVVQGDFGNSWLNRRPILNEFSQRLPNTIALAFSALFITITFGLSLGIIAAIRQNKPIDAITLVFALVFASMPTFWCGLMMQLLFALRLGWFPAMGVGTLRHMVMPAFALSLFGLASQVRMTRSSMLDVIKMDYIRTARAKGSGELRVVFLHVIRNGLMPVVTNLGISLASYMGGSIITETIFSIPGIGSYLINSIKGRDIPVVMAVIIFVAIFVALSNLIVDIIYAFIDPRVKLGYMS